MKIRRAAALTLLTVSSGMLSMSDMSEAQSNVWVQVPIGVPRAPGCDPGYSWQKIGNRYRCATPPPSCDYGFANSPTWTGSSWSYSCNPPPQPPSVPLPPLDPRQQCIAAGQSLGLYNFGYEDSRPAASNPGQTAWAWLTDGPYGTSGDQCGSGSTKWEFYCISNPDGSVYQYDAVNQGGMCGGQGG
jgi:hypothetical protein